MTGEGTGAIAEARPGRQPVAAMMEASSIAVVGASDSPGPGRNVVRNLAEAGFVGRVYLINKSHPRVNDVPAYADVAHLPEVPELVVVAVNQRATVEIVRTAAAMGVPGAVLLAAGFRETGADGAALEAEIRRVKGDMALVGPNCLGFANYTNGLAAYSGPLVEQKRFGNVALVSNSGALACTLTGAAAERRISFSHVVTMGNQVDLGLADYLQYFSTEAHVDVIACYVEGFDDGRAVLSAIGDAVEHGKLVVMLKSGRTRLGGRAALTHTGALAGSALVQEDLFRRSGVVLAKDLEELLALIELGSRCPRFSGERVGVITTSGGERLLLADAVEENSLDLAELSPDSRAELQALLPPFAVVANPLDTTGAGIFEGDVKTHYEAARVMALDPDVDVLVASYDAKNGWVESAQSAPAFVDGVIAAHKAAAEAGKPVVIISLTTGNVDSAAREYLEENRVACLMGLQPAMRTISLLLARARAHQVEPARTGGPEAERTPVASVAGASALALGGREGVQLPLADALRRLEKVGLSGWESVTATDEQAAVAAAQHVGYPVAMKWDGNIAHRARIGGVALGLKNETAVREAWRSLSERAAQLRIDYAGMVVQSMVEGDLELFVGGVRDQQFGPIVLFGLGGIRVEEAGQVAVALAPMTRREAELLVEASPCAAVIGQREAGGLLDREAVLDAVVAVAELMSDTSVLAVDVNPLIALPRGVAVVDCKVVVAGPAPAGVETAVEAEGAPEGPAGNEGATR